MKNFFKSRIFKVIVAVAVVLAGLMIGAAASGRSFSFPSSLIGAITQPFQTAAAKIENAFRSAGDWLTRRSEVFTENEALRKEAAELRARLAEYEAAAAENKRLKDALGIKELRKDFELVDGVVISGGGSEYSASFTVNRGTKHGVKLKDAVVTAEGVVGFVSEVNYNFCRVTTLFSSACSIGGCDVASRDFGILTGSDRLASENLFLLAYLPLESTAAAGDIVITSGLGSVFPAGLVAGTVTRVSKNEQGLSLDAAVSPAADFSGLKDVLIIINYDPELNADYSMPGPSAASEPADGE